jgi:hypothetical protein
MSVENLSNSQLYAIIQNEQMDASIRKIANEEFTRRNLTIEQIQEIVRHFDLQYKPARQEGLGLANKIFLVAVPAFFTIQVLVAGRYLASGQKKKWKDFWRYVCLGWLVWTIGFILYFRFARR